MDKMKDVKQMLTRTSPEELQAYLQFRRRGSKVPSKKGKGSFTRKVKHKLRDTC